MRVRGGGELEGGGERGEGGVREVRKGVRGGLRERREVREG